jgi:hypothetical protein
MSGGFSQLQFQMNVSPALDVTDRSELVKQLSERGLATTGLKGELQARLLEDVLNSTSTRKRKAEEVHDECPMSDLLRINGSGDIPVCQRARHLRSVQRAAAYPTTVPVMPWISC